VRFLERLAFFAGIGLVAAVVGLGMLFLRVRRLRAVEAGLTEADRQRLVEEIHAWKREGLAYRERLQRLVDRGMPRDNAEIHLARAEELWPGDPGAR
jgi:hypothetical protein